jgi:hypothetical protein
VSLASAADNIHGGDLLLFRSGREPLGRAISIVGRGEYSHCGMAAWWGGDLMLLEVREWIGGRAILLEREVARRPDQIDVYGVAPKFVGSLHAMAAIGAMRRLAGASYGWWSVLRVSLLHLPVLRLFARAMTDDEMNNGRPPFCSQAISYAYRTGGRLDPLCNLADAGTEPSDLARSPVFQYRFTLRP